MKSNNYTFRIIIEQDGKKAFHGYAPALPGCHTWGETIEKTKANLKDAIAVYIAGLIEDKQPVPEENGLEFFATISDKELQLV